jgi:hypothetical protein
MQAFCRFYAVMVFVRRDMSVVKCAPLLGACLLADELNGKQVRERQFPKPELPPQR